MGYRELEHLLPAAIADRFGFEWPMSLQIVEFGHRNLLEERDQSMAAPPRGSG